MAKKTGATASMLKSTMEPKLLFSDWMDKWQAEGGVLNSGEAICEQPKDQRMMLHATTPIGHGTLLYLKMTYTMPKYHYNLEKVDEYMVVSPAYPEMYGRIVAKKRELEGQIKTGMASAAQAVADYELLKHDERKYREILDYFNEGRKDEHVLRALFVDRIDAHTGEGYSMISMTKRWPTIITDFLRLSSVNKEGRKDVKVIKKELEISVAEATVLKTKNEVFNKWTKVFFPDIRDRYIRIKNLVEARRKSVDEYREWLKPYVASLKMLRESLEKDPSEVLTSAILPWHKPQGMYGTKVWMWKAFTAEEVGKPGMVEGEIQPYDDFVKRYKKKIEKNYGVRIVFKRTDADKIIEEENLGKDDIIVVEEKLKEWAELSPMAPYEKQPKLNKNFYYYAFYDLTFISPIFKLEGGKEEVDDWNADIKPYLVSQNVVLIGLLELEAKKKWMNKYVKELIGVREVEDKLRKEINEMYPGMEAGEESKKRLEGMRNFVTGVREKKARFNRRVDDWWFEFKPKGRSFLKYFMRIGPYETVRTERLSKMYGRYMGSSMTDPFIKFLKTEIGKLSGVQPP